MFGTTLTRYLYNSRDCTTLESSMAPIQRFKHDKKVSHSRLCNINSVSISNTVKIVQGV